VLHGGSLAGLSLDLGLHRNEQAFVSLATVDAAVSEPGTRVTVLWGGGPQLRQARRRAAPAGWPSGRRSPPPYVREVRDSYRAS